MAAPRIGKVGGKKASAGTAPKKKSAKAVPLATPVDPASETVIDAADAPVELTDEAIAAVSATEEAPLDLAEETPAEDAPEDPAVAAIYATPAPAADEPAAETAEADPAEATLDLQGVEERLPWLESDDDFDKENSDGGRIAGFMIGGLLALAVIVGAIWWVAHREKPEEIAGGGVIEAPAVAYKEAPKNPGGKQFEGTGDSAPEVSEGKNPSASLSGGTLPPKPEAGTPAATASTAPKAAASTPATPPKPAVTPEASGVGVQIAAFTSKAQAEAGWTKLAGQHDALKGVAHRVVEGKADIGTVYRLQAVPGDIAAANALCSRLKSAGAACQVKR